MSPWPPIKIAGGWEPIGQGPIMDLERRVAYGLLNLPANALSQDTVDLHEFRMIPREDGWLIMLKGKRGDRKLIAWIHGPTWGEALLAATTSVDSGHVPWRADDQSPWDK